MGHGLGPGNMGHQRHCPCQVLMKVGAVLMRKVSMMKDPNYQREVDLLGKQIQYKHPSPISGSRKKSMKIFHLLASKLPSHQHLPYAPTLHKFGVYAEYNLGWRDAMASDSQLPSPRGREYQVAGFYFKLHTESGQTKAI